MRTKSWPLWETWKCIFGKDRAIGGEAETVGVASVSAREQLQSGSQCNENDYRPSFDDFPIGDSPPTPLDPINQDNGSRNTERDASTNRAGSQRSKQHTSDAPLMEFLGNLHASNARLEVISTRIGYEFDMGKARQEVFDKLGSVEGLTLEQRYDLCDILSDKTQRLEVFIGMPANARLGYVLRFLEPNHGRG